jgi:xanthine dehydrogenase accessory factor
MKEIQEIILAHDHANAAGLKTALATVVKVEGSAYRREGARMLISENGTLTGAISGGCLEGDALRRALQVMSSGRATVVAYDSRDDDHQIGLQLGCNGLIYLLIEPILAENEASIFLLKKLIGRRENAIAVTFFSLENRLKTAVGTKFIFFENEEISIQPIDNQLVALIKKTFFNKKTAIETLFFDEKETDVLLEFLPPAPALIVFGAGNDVQPLVKMAAILGWSISVIDGRPKLATKTRFPEATMVLVANSEAALTQIPSDEQTFFLLMTHNYRYDFEILRQLLLRKTKYVGILGPRKKTEQMMEELNTQFLDNQLVIPENCFSPIGLDLGGDTPENIALSILAEIQAVLFGRNGAHLRDRKTPIHA